VRACAQLGGVRAKLLTADGNDIDTMFVDRRHDNKHHDNADTLVRPGC